MEMMNQTSIVFELRQDVQQEPSLLEQAIDGNRPLVPEDQITSASIPGYSNGICDYVETSIEIYGGCARSDAQNIMTMATCFSSPRIHDNENWPAHRVTVF